MDQEKNKKRKIKYITETCCFYGIVNLYYRSSEYAGIGYE